VAEQLLALQKGLNAKQIVAKEARKSVAYSQELWRRSVCLLTRWTRSEWSGNDFTVQFVGQQQSVERNVSSSNTDNELHCSVMLKRVILNTINSLPESQGEGLCSQLREINTHVRFN
jgi:hypothetical protein